MNPQTKGKYYLCNMKVKLHVNWKKVIVFLLISAGLIYLTYSFTHSYSRSLLMSIGILLLLFVIDGLLANYEYRRQTKALFDDLRQGHEEARQDNDKDKRQDKWKN